MADISGPGRGSENGERRSDALAAGGSHPNDIDAEAVEAGDGFKSRYRGVKRTMAKVVYIGDTWSKPQARES